MGQRSKNLTLLWAFALLVTVVNALAVVWRLPVQRHLANDADEQAVQDAVRWIAPLPTNARLLLLVSNQDQTHFHFSTRLIYFLYPHHIDIVSNSLPPDALSRYEGILAFGRMAPVLEARQKQEPLAWRMAGQDSRALLAFSNRLANAAPVSTPEPRLPFILRLVSGAFSLLAVVVLGVLLMTLTLRAPPFETWWANFAIAHLIGVAAFAVMQTLCIACVGKPLVWPVYVGVAGLCAVCLGRRAEPLRCMACGPVSFGHNSVFREFLSEGQSAERHTAKGFSPSPQTHRFVRQAVKENWRDYLCRAALLLGVFTALERMGLIGLDWDAVAIWQLKAKVLFLDGNLSLWQNPAQFPYAHFDYPLLTPLLTWWNYRHFNAIDLHWAQANGLLFYADLLAIFAASALRYVPPVYALVATALLSGLPEVTLHAVSGYADLPLALYMLGAGVFLMRVLVERENAAWPLVGWMLAGVILVKNEGLLACVSAFLVIGWHFLRARRVPPAVPADNSATGIVPPASTIAGMEQATGTEIAGNTAAASTGNAPQQKQERRLSWWLLAPVLACLPWWLLKQRWNLTNDVMQPTHPPHFTIRLLWWRMWYAMVYGFGKQFVWLGPRFPAWGLLGVIILAGGIAARKRRLALTGPLWLFAGVQFCGYIGIYMITPSALPAHIISSVERLTLHVAPLLLLAALISCFAEEQRA